MSANIFVELPDAALRQNQITPNDAEAAVASLDARLEKLSPPPTQIGSVEGTIARVDRYRSSPALLIKERISGKEIRCTVPEELRMQFANEASIDDVWSGSRVIVKGTISYSEDRSISRIEASGIRRIVPEMIPVESIQDSSFTKGLTAEDYLEKFREGNLE